jgi:hypothetical protein
MRHGVPAGPGARDATLASVSPVRERGVGAPRAISAPCGSPERSEALLIRSAPMKRGKMARKAPRRLPAEIRNVLLVRSRGVCEVWDMGARCDRPGQHFHHVAKKRSQGGRAIETMATAADWIVTICGPHHDHADNRGFSDPGGRLVGIPLGRGLFHWQVIEAPKPIAKDMIAELTDDLGGLEWPR